MQTDCLILPSIADKTKHEVERALVWKRLFTARCHVSDWCNRLSEMWPWRPLSSSFTEAFTTVRVWGTFRYQLLRMNFRKCYKTCLPVASHAWWQKTVTSSISYKILLHVSD
jgi:hypothetical protein